MTAVHDSFKKRIALAGVAQWIECWPVNQELLVLFPVKAHDCAAGQVPSGGRVRGNHTLMFLSRINVFLPLFIPSPLSKNK